MLLDPGMNLTLRPMRYPHFYDRYRDAIKNTWTVEEVDLALRPQGPAAAQRRRAAPGVAAGGVLRDRRHDRRQQPGAQPLPAHQLARGPAVPVAPAVRGGGARAVLPDAARHLRARRGRAPRGVRGGRQHPVDQGQGRLLLPVDRLGLRPRRARDPGAPADVPAQPDLLRRGDRGAVLLRGVRLRLLPALARLAQRPGVRHQLGLPRRVDAHGLRLRRGRHGARGGAGPLRRRDGGAGPADADRRRSTRRRSSPRTSSAAASPGCRRPTCAPTWSTSPTGGWSASACR